jgi:hypothetical protein
MGAVHVTGFHRRVSSSCLLFRQPALGRLEGILADPKPL